MPCTTRRPSSCQPQLHKRMPFCGKLSVLKFPSPVGTRPLSAWLFGGCRLLVRSSGSSRSQRRGPEGDFLPQICAVGVLLVSCLQVSRLLRGAPLHPRRTTFANSGQASVLPSTTPLVKLSPSSCPCGFGCQVRVSLHVSDGVASQVSLCTRCFGRHSAACSSPSSSSES